MIGGIDQADGGVDRPGLPAPLDRVGRDLEPVHGVAEVVDEVGDVPVLHRVRVLTLGGQQHAVRAVGDAHGGQAHPLVVEDRERLVITGEPGEGDHDVVLRAGQGDPAAVDDSVRTEVLTEDHAELGAPAGGHGHGVRCGLGDAVSLVEGRIVGRVPGGDAVADADLVGLLRRGVVADGEGDGLRAVLALSEGDGGLVDAGGAVHRADHVEQSRSLAVDRLEVAGIRRQRPGHRIRAAHHRGLHLTGRELRGRLQHQRCGAGHVRGRHRGAGLGALAAQLERERRPDRAARCGDVRLELQLGGEAVGGELRDQARGRVLEGHGALLPGPAHVCGGERLLQREPVGLIDQDHRDGDRGLALDARVHGAGGVVVEDHRVVARGLTGGGLLVEGADAALDQQRLAGAGGRGDCRGIAGLPRLGACGSGGDQAELARGRGFRATAGHAVGDLRARRLGVGRAEMGVVHRGDGDRLGRDTGGPAREGPGGALVACGDHQGDAVGGEHIGELRGRVVLPGREGCAERHVHHVGAVLQRSFHRLEDHVGAAAAVASEDPVGQQVDTGCDAEDLAVGPDDPRDVGAVAPAVVRELVRGDGDPGVGVVVVAHEVVPADDAVVREVCALVVDAGAAEVGVVVVDAGVDHRDGDSLTGQSVDLLQLVDTGHRVAVDVVRGDICGLGHLDLEHRVHRSHALHIAELGDVCVIHRDGHAVPAGHEGLLDLHRDLRVLSALMDPVLRLRVRGGAAAAAHGVAVDLDEPAARDRGLRRVQDVVRRGDLDAELRGGPEELGLITVGERGWGDQQAGHEGGTGASGEHAAGSEQIWAGELHRRIPPGVDGEWCAARRRARAARSTPASSIPSRTAQPGWRFQE